MDTWPTSEILCFSSFHVQPFLEIMLAHVGLSYPVTKKFNIKSTNHTSPMCATVVATYDYFTFPHVVNSLYSEQWSKEHFKQFDITAHILVLRISCHFGISKLFMFECPVYYLGTQQY